LAVHRLEAYLALRDQPDQLDHKDRKVRQALRDRRERRAFLGQWDLRDQRDQLARLDPQDREEKVAARRDHKDLPGPRVRPVLQDLLGLRVILVFRVQRVRLDQQVHRESAD
jgi:hypothetical protein